LKYIKTFPIPKSWDELRTWITRHKESDRPRLREAAARGFNLAVKQSTEEKSND